MTIDEAINHAKEVAERNRKQYKNCPAERQDIEHQTCEMCAQQHEQLAKWLEEIQQYRAIGTVEECRVAMERQKGKKPNKIADKYSDLIQHYFCPVCERYFGQAGVHNVILFDNPKYCTCGQAIDWPE